MNERHKPAELLAEIYKHAGARNWDGVAPLLHPEFTVYEAESLPFGGAWTGPEAFPNVAAAVFGTWAEASTEIHEIVGGEEWAVVILTFTMTSKTTGNTFKQTVNEAGRFVDGKLRELRIHYFDTAEIARESGHVAG